MACGISGGKPFRSDPETSWLCEMAPALKVSNLVVPSSVLSSSHVTYFRLPVYMTTYPIEKIQSKSYQKDHPLKSFFPSSLAIKMAPPLIGFLSHSFSQRHTNTRVIRLTPKGPPSRKKLRQAQMLLFESREQVWNGSPADLITPPTSSLPKSTFSCGQ